MLRWLKTASEKNVKPGLPDPGKCLTSTIKPLHAQWVNKTHKMMEKENTFIVNAFTSAGIDNS